MVDLRIYLLGTPRVVSGDTLAETGRRKATALLSYLVLNKHIQRRETLAAIFWPESSSSIGRADLSRILSVLRKHLGKGWLVSDRQTVGLAPGVNLWVDVLEFQQLLTQTQSHAHAHEQVCQKCLRALGKAIELYQGDFMAGLTLADSPEFDDWQALQTEGLRQELAAALEHLARLQALNRDFQTAVQMAQRRLNLDPLHEPAQRQLMRLYAWSGNRSAAIRQYQACRRVLDLELGLPPETATRELYDVIQAGLEILPLSTPSSNESLTIIPHNIPPQHTPFVGRQEELAQIKILIQSEPACRLLTLVGPGGIGKTRLAVQTALHIVSDVNEHTLHGVYFVSLAPLNNPETLIPTIAESLNLSFYSGVPLRQQLLNYLSQKSLLLILDNLEHLLPSAHSSSPEDSGQVVELLMAIIRSAPDVKLLVTSRERLNLQEEWVFEVSGMLFPTSSKTEKDAGNEYSAVELFGQRARRARATFVLTEVDREDVIRICQLVAGVPLAIELAAAWVRMMPCRDIVREIERGLDFLTTSLRDVPERHRSLRTVFEQSWSHLSDEESAVFKKLSIFQGGFHLRAAERVVDATLPLLSALMNKSLLQRTRNGRYKIHELLRQFAAEKLAINNAEMTQVRNREAEFFAVFLQQRQDKILGHRQRETLTEILAYIDNIRTAWRWNVAHKQVDAIGKSLECFFTIYWFQGWFAEGETIFQQAIYRLADINVVTDLQNHALTKQQKAVLGKLLTVQGFFCVRLGRYQHALSLAQQGVGLLRQAGADFQADIAYGLLQSSIVDEVNGRYNEANQKIEEFGRVYDGLGNRWGVGTSLVRTGQVARRQGKLEKAQSYLEQGITILKSIHDQKGLAYARDDFGHTMRSLGDYSQALNYYEDALKLRRNMRDREGMILSLRNIGDIQRMVGAYNKAEQCYRESLTLAREVGYSLKVADSLEGLGMVARLQREFDQAEQAHQESLTIYEAMGHWQRNARCQYHLGRLAFDQEEYELAEHYFQKSLEISQQHGFKPETLLCFCQLGCLRLQVNSKDLLGIANQYFSWALILAKEVKSVPLALEILPGLALLLKRFGDEKGAVELLSFVSKHPGGAQEIKDWAIKLHSEFRNVSYLSEASAFPAHYRRPNLWDLINNHLQMIQKRNQS